MIWSACFAVACESGRKPARLIVPSHWNPIAKPAGAAPEARNYHAMAFDSDRSKLLLFGGTAGGETLADLWEWDSRSRAWTDRTPRPLPAAWPADRLVPAFAYDRGRKRVVLFGGFLGNSQTGGRPFGDTWEWDPATGIWTDVTPAPGLPSPSPRQSMGAAYDESRGRTFIWGGFDESGLRPLDAWEWDGHLRAWTDRAPDPLPASWPAGRDGHSLTYDPVGRRVILFGGYDGDYFGDLWAWDGAAAAWNNLTPSPLPETWPLPRHSAATAFDRRLNRLVVFAGFNNDTLGDLWEWARQDERWRDRTPVSLEERWPSPRYGSVMAWDEVSERLLLFGGNGPTPVRNEIWEWDGS